MLESINKNMQVLIKYFSKIHVTNVKIQQKFIFLNEFKPKILLMLSTVKSETFCQIEYHYHNL